MIGKGLRAALPLALALSACSVSHGEQGNTSGSNWLRCKVLDECSSPEAVRCSGDGYCLDTEGGRIAAPSSAVDDGGPASQAYALCDGSDAIRLAVVSEGGHVDSTYEFTNPYGHSYLFVDGRCHYYASRGWVQGTVEGDLSAAQAAQIAQRLELDRLAQFSYHDLESCPDAGPIWARAGTGYVDCTCGCDASAPAAIEPLINAAGALRDELIDAGRALGGDVELFALAIEDTIGAQDGDVSWPFSWPIAEVAVTQEQLFMDSSIPQRRTLQGDEAGSARALRASALAKNQYTNRLRVLQAGAAYLIYARDTLPAGAQAAIEQVMSAQAAVLSSL